MSSSRRRLAAAAGVVARPVLAIAVSLTAVAACLALLGYGASGAFLTLARGWLLPRFGHGQQYSAQPATASRAKSEEIYAFGSAKTGVSGD